MAIRAKMKLTAIVTQEFGNGYSQKNAKFTAQYDPSLAEDQKFQKATPSASCDFQIDNPAAIDQLEVGKDYYFDIHPAT